jgi:hypothetical protein
VDLAEDEAAARAEGHDPLPHVAPHLVGRRLRQDALGVAAAAPEGQVLAEFPLERRRVHAPGARLHGIDDLDPNFDEVRQDAGDRAAGVQEKMDALAPPDPLEEDLLARLENFAIGFWRDGGGSAPCGKAPSAGPTR